MYSTECANMYGFCTKKYTCKINIESKTFKMTLCKKTGCRYVQFVFYGVCTSIHYEKLT